MAEGETKVIEKKEYDIGKTLKQVGILYPVIADARGRIIDGYHRLAVDPQWPIYQLTNIKTDEQYVLAKLIANLHRREVGVDEKSKLLGELAKLTKWTPKELAERLGMSFSWIMKYLPDRFKSKVKAESGKLGGQAKAEKTATHRVAKPEQPSPATLPVESENLEAAASLSKETPTVRFEPSVGEPVEGKKPKTFRCRVCMEVYEEPIKPVHVVLCPECEMRFQMWKAEKDVEKT